MNRISLRLLKAALFFGLAVSANLRGGWLICKPAARGVLNRLPVEERACPFCQAMVTDAVLEEAA
jgi:hypothetical protein